MNRTALKRGTNSIRQNVTTLMSPLLGQARKKAIHTLARTRNMTLQDAQFLQATRIAQKQARKR